MAAISVIVPAYNEGASIARTVAVVTEAFAGGSHAFELIVVDDGSTDDTAGQAEAAGVRVIRHPTNKGYGNALLTGVRNAAHPWIGIVDADGTYPVEELPTLLDEAVARDLAMLVGARQGRHYREGLAKRFGRRGLQWFAEFVVGQEIPDVNSGMRIIRRDLVAQCAPALSGGFSFTTSITIIAFQTGHHVAYRPIAYHARTGTSHVRYRRDVLRAMQIIVMTIVLFNPIKLYLVQALGVALFTAGAMLLAALLPASMPVLLMGSLGFYTTNIILALGFLALRHQANLADLHLPERGYQAPTRDG